MIGFSSMTAMGTTSHYPQDGQTQPLLIHLLRYHRENQQYE